MPIITSPIIIQNGTIDGGFANYRIFLVDNSGTGDLTLLNMRLQNGGSFDFDTSGGAISNNGSLRVINTIIKGSWSDINGGAISNTGDVLVVNSLFFDNRAQSTGGAIQNNSTGTVTIINSTFSDNFAVSGGGAVANTGTMTIHNSILWGNTDEVYDNVNRSKPTITYSIVEDDAGDYDGTNVLDADPAFDDPDNGDYSLTSTSAAINTGSIDLLPDEAASDLDLDIDGDSTE